MSFKYTILILLAITITLSCTTQNKKSDKVNLDTIDAIVKSALEDKHVPSFAVGVVKDGQVVYSKVFGFVDVEKKVKADKQTYYQLGSVTKTMTGYVLTHLVEKGTVSLSAPLSSYFPESVDFPKGPNGEVITVQHMATHSAGFPRYPENLERVDPNPILGYTREQLYRGIELVDVETIPGEEYYYSNFGYGVLGIALENATGKSLNELMQTYLFKPAGMSHSSLVMDEEIRSRLATPYLEVNPYLETKPWRMEALSGAGNVFSSLEDMNQFLLHLLKDNSINRQQQTRLLSTQQNEDWYYGLGCFVVDDQNLETLRITHGGDVDGYASTINLYPEYNLGMVIMTNNGDSGLLGPIFADIRNTITSIYIEGNKN